MMTWRRFRREPQIYWFSMGSTLFLQSTVRVRSDMDGKEHVCKE